MIALSAVSTAPMANAASPSDFTSASNSIGAAYLAVSHAQQQGGNVSALVDSLNMALGLYTRAQAENSSSPSKATSDLQNATVIAQQVALAAPTVGQAGAAARQTQEYASVGAAAVIIAIAALLYVYGEKIYHRIWLRLYSGYVVKRVG